MKVLHAVSVMNRAGQETFIMNVFRNMDRSKIMFDFQCSVNEKGDFDEEIKSLGGKIYYLGKNPISVPILRYLGEILRQRTFFIKHPGYQIYHIHTYQAFDAVLAILGAKLGGVKNICVHSHNTKGLHPQLHKIFRVILNHMNITKFACSYAAGVWMYGEKYMQNNQVEIIKNGIQVKGFAFDEKKRIAKREELGISDKFVVGHIGRFNYQKNHDFLIDIFKAISQKNENAILLLIGIGELQEQIRKKVYDLGLEKSVMFLGTREDIVDILSAMDLFVFPSLFEGLSVVAIEAQAAGTPILASSELTSETKITDLLQFFPLSKSSDEWAMEALKVGKLEHKNTENDIKDAGYDIKDTAKRLCEIYQLKGTDRHMVD